MGIAGPVLVCIMLGYLLGSLSPSYLIGKCKGYDVRDKGTGNAGASNTVILAGKKSGFIVAVLDIVKAALAWKFCAALFPSLAFAGPLGGTSAIFGHMFSIFLHFRGGKGLSCLGGVILAHDPRAFLTLLFVALTIAVLTKYVCIVTSLMSVIWPVYYGIVTGFVLGAILLLLPALPIILKHVPNFKRIRSGEELRLTFLWKKDEELKRIGRMD